MYTFPIAAMSAQQLAESDEDSIKVFVRVRPVARDTNTERCVDVSGEKTIVMCGREERSFTFDHISDDQSSQVCCGVVCCGVLCCGVVRGAHPLRSYPFEPYLQ